MWMLTASRSHHPATSRAGRPANPHSITCRVNRENEKGALLQGAVAIQCFLKVAHRKGMRWSRFPRRRCSTNKIPFATTPFWCSEAPRREPSPVDFSGPSPPHHDTNNNNTNNHTITTTTTTTTTTTNSTNRTGNTNRTYRIVLNKSVPGRAAADA